MNLPKKENYRLDEVANFFGVHKNTIRNWIHAGNLHTEKINRPVKIPQTALESLLKKSK